MTEPVQFGMLFPFIYFLVRDFNITKDDRDMGFYVGILASSFPIAQLFSSLPWGYISDRIGRRPVILIGLIGNAVTCALFGISQSFGFAVAIRTVCGLLNGNVGVIKSMLGEITDSSNRGLAFAYWESAFGIGTIFGPVIGGLLVDPVHQIPWLFGNSDLFRQFPYLLPCIVSAVISVMGAIAGYFLLEETLKRPKPIWTSWRSRDQIIRRGPRGGVQHTREPVAVIDDQPDSCCSNQQRGFSQYDEPAQPVSNYGAACDSVEPEHNGTPPDSDLRPSVLTLAGSEPEINHNMSSEPHASNLSPTVVHESILASQAPSLISLDSFANLPDTSITTVLTRNVIFCISSYAVWSFLQVMYDETYALFIATPLNAGGLQFTSFEMGVLLSLVGCSQVVGQLIVYPMVERWYGYVGCYRIASVIMIVFSIVLPFVGDLARWIVKSPDGTYTQSEKLIVFCALMFVLAGRNIGCVIGYIAVMILVNDSAPGKHALGTVHGFGQVAASFVRSIGPALGGSLWAWSLTNHLGFPFDFHFTLFVTALLAVVAFWISFLIRHGPDHEHDEVFAPLNTDHGYSVISSA